MNLTRERLADWFYFGLSSILIVVAFPLFVFFWLWSKVEKCLS
jgi:hypothetical protein